jgi:alkylation response protein AidB-like acyl-CoA dehydrogenase
MDLRETAAHRALRRDLREWLAANLDEQSGELTRTGGRDWQRKIAAGGWGAPRWPVEFGGRGFGPLESAIVEEEMARARAPRSIAVIGVGWAGPAIIGHGSEDQKRRLLPRILNGDDVWCQLFSEPDAGSDLAALRTRAQKHGDRYIVDGQKIWTSYAEEADFGILLARTDPASDRHAGISCFAIPMRQPGIEIRPIRQMDGRATFNQVFFTRAEVLAENLIGAEGAGWPVAISTLMNERTALSTGAGTLWGDGPTLDDVVRLAQKVGATSVQRQRLAALKVEAEAIRLTGWRMLSGDARAGSMTKLAADVWGQQVNELAVELLGMAGAVESPWTNGFLFSRALTIGGGTTEIQKNVLAERVLGLPRP